MKRFFVGLCLVLMVCTAAAAVQSKWQTYKGAWFSIQYPAEFKTRGSLKSASSDAGYDSMFFKSPDGRVEFYVYSPQWNGEPTDIAINPKTEKEVAKLAGTANGIRTVRVTIKAKNGSYTRSFVDTTKVNENTRTVFGIKYRNQKAYNKYKAQYLKFKGSLVQYAD